MARRTRLIEQMSSEPLRNWIIEAGAGYGKSVLINELRSALVQPLILVRPNPEPDLSGLISELVEATRRVRLPQLSEELSAASGAVGRIAWALQEHQCCVAIDDVHWWGSDIEDFVIEVGAALAETKGGMLAVAGRTLPPRLLELSNDPVWSTLDAPQLALTLDEIAETLRASGIDDASIETIAHPLQELSGGWPAAVAVLAARADGVAAKATGSLARYDSLVDRLVGGYLDELEPSDLQSARSLALLPFFDAAVADLVADRSLLSRLAEAGIPMTRQADGWTELPEQFRASLMRRSDMSTPPVPRDVISYFVDRGEIHAAINSCLAAGDNLGAASVVADASYAQEEQLDPTALNAAMTTIGPVAEQVPRSLLVQAQVNVSHGAFTEGLACIERAARAAAAADPGLNDAVHLEILLELGLWRHFSGEQRDAFELVERCSRAMSSLPFDESRAAQANRARLLDLQGLLSTTEDTRDGLEQARVQLTEALAIWRQLREPRAAAATVLRLVSDVLIELGRRHEAIALLDGLPAIGPLSLLNRARIQLQRVRVLPFVGRGSELADALDEARRAAEVLQLDWLSAMADCFEAVAASIAGDCERVQQLFAFMLDRPDRFAMRADERAGWCLLADALTRCESYEDARMALARAQEDDGPNQPLYDFTLAALEAHDNDPEAATATLEQLTLDPGQMPERRWAISLFSALAAHRSGKSLEASKLLDEALREAAAIDHPALPFIAERRVVERIRRGMPVGPAPGPPDSGERSTATGAVDAPVAAVVDITLFDQFLVRLDGRPAKIPSGQISDLVKLLVLADGHMVVDQVIDRLWPDADLTLGRQRLRNVLKRLRKASDRLVERSGDALVLAGQVDSDYARALAAAEEAFAGSASLAEVSEAVRLNARDLLIDDLYADWAEDARRVHRQRVVRLLDRQADLAERQGELDLAVDALEAAHVADGAGPERIVHACGLLRAAGREAAAAATARRHGLSR